MQKFADAGHLPLVVSCAQHVLLPEQRLPPDALSTSTLHVVVLAPEYVDGSVNAMPLIVPDVELLVTFTQYTSAAPLPGLNGSLLA
jgi:hypothetical protein